MSEEEKMEWIPIGFVKTQARGREVREKSRVSTIVIREELVEALKGLDDFSHVLILFWMHKITVRTPSPLQVHPRGRPDMPRVGIFATRTSHRPNPIGLTLVELVRVEANIVTVRGLDAFDGTPVLDLKPYDYMDVADGVRVPAWWLRLRARCSEK
jgi:tRNA-Thr(GGU) m(6)t(6)A37 methyltransferase TsaA